MRVFKSLIILVGTIIFSLFLVLLLGIIGLRAMVLLWGYGDVYQTEDPAHYGEYIGNFDDKTPAAFINSFFPETIDTSFSNVQYHYKAKKEMLTHTRQFWNSPSKTQICLVLLRKNG